MKLLRSLYDWVLHLAATPYAVPALFAVSFIESSFFPIPPDVLLIAMTVAVPALWFRYALLCTSASVLGGIFGYIIGWKFMDVIGYQILDFYHLQNKFDKIGVVYQEYEAWAVAGSGFTPIPYKLFTLAAGAFKIDLPTFVLASAIGRAARFFLVGYLIYKFGPTVKEWIEKYFGWFSLFFFISLFLGFYLLKFVL
ncbi:MAG: cytochrome b561 [Nitrospinaceae bacterium]|nr:MAG: cytochrome b561 [Nitrospinaceae bacterium]